MSNGPYILDSVHLNPLGCWMSSTPHPAGYRFHSDIAAAQWPLLARSTSRSDSRSHGREPRLPVKSDVCITTTTYQIYSNISTWHNQLQSFHTDVLWKVNQKNPKDIFVCQALPSCEFGWKLSLGWVVKATCFKWNAARTKKPLSIVKVISSAPFRGICPGMTGNWVVIRCPAWANFNTKMTSDSSDSCHLSSDSSLLRSPEVPCL